MKHNLARSCFQFWPPKSAPRVIKFRKISVSANASPVIFRNFAKYYYVLFECNFSSHQMRNEISPTSSNNNFATSFSAALAFWRGSTISWMTYLRMLRERKFSFGWKSDNHHHYLIILSEDSSPGGLSLHLRQSRAHHRSQPWQDVHCPSVVHFPKQLNKLFIGWIMATC